MTAKTRSAIAWVYLAPSLIMMFLVGVIPLAMVFFYSVNDTFAGNNFIFVGAKWFEQVLTSPEFHAAFLRSLGFTLMVLMVEIPLGIFIALRMPARGWLTGTYVVLMALPLLMPSLVVGYLWQILALADAGLLGAGAARLGLTWDMNSVAVTWATLVLMDVWHWTGFVVLLCFAGLRAIPDACYQAAQIDGARPWAVFRHVQLPRLKLVLLVALLLRFMDSLHDLYRGLCRLPRRSRGLDHLPQPRAGADRDHPVRPRRRRGDGGDLFSDRPLRGLGLLQPDRRPRPRQWSPDMNRRFSLVPAVYVALVLLPV